VVLEAALAGGGAGQSTPTPATPFNAFCTPSILEDNGILRSGDQYLQGPQLLENMTLNPKPKP